MGATEIPEPSTVGERSGDDYLGIYLADHHAGACGGIELAKRCLASNEDNELGSFLRDFLLPAIEEDLVALEEIMDRVGAAPQWWKDAGAWAAEKAGRLKFNGQLRGYSPLSRMVELEGLALGIHGKRGLWTALKELAASDLRLQNLDLDDLVRRADEQRAEVERRRLAMAAGIFR